MTMRTPISRVRGLGSAKEGAHHWWMQRLTAIALIPLGIWFVISMIGLAGTDHAAASAWLANPLTAVLMLLLIIATFYHLQLGLQVVIEDYIHGEAAKMVCLIALKLASFALGVAAIFVVLKVAF
jgi:succinate dehydrogenase / fumarate reductase membrane anchor subunit